MKRRPYVLGLDLGPNSIGWAMLDQDPESGEPVGFYDTSVIDSPHPPMGVRVFEAGLENFETAKEKSRSQQRRMMRSLRRNHARRNARRAKVKRLLTGAGLLPDDEMELAALFRTDPYEIRARALSEDLTVHEVGRALFHLAQRRGFKSNRKSGDDKEEGKVLEEIGKLEHEMREAGSKTLGQHFAALRAGKKEMARPRVRAQHTRRDMYEVEFSGIVERQKQAHPGKLTDDFVGDLHEAVFFQRPFAISEERRKNAPSRANLHRAPSVRPCPFEEGEKCCNKGHWKAQRFRILKEVANLTISEHHHEERELTTEERDFLIDELSVAREIKFDQIRKKLHKVFGTDPDARFNLERGGRKKLLGNTVENKLANAFSKKKWATMPEDTKVRLRELLLDVEDPAALEEALRSHGLDENKVSKLMEFSPPDGYLGYSLKAIDKLLVHMEHGKDEHDAIQAVYGGREEVHGFDKLPALVSDELPAEIHEITNPVVRRALVEVRKVVNALTREHGRPARIVVELAREMKDGQEGRKEYSRRIRGRQEEREEAKKRVLEHGGNQASRSDVNRWLYWKEQGGACLYTGQSIPASEIFNGGAWDVDHILPRWRSLDDSMMNKALVSREANARKANRTPAEWLGTESQEFKQLVKRASELEKSGTLPTPKLMRLKAAKLDTDDFAKRQLNDTRYITRAVVKYLELLYPAELRHGEKAVMSSRGGLTSELRHHLGLNRDVFYPLLDSKGNDVKPDEEARGAKSRIDHRHHAVDAVVVALSSRAFLKRYQDYWKRRADPHVKEPEFPPPWESLRNEVRRHADEIQVSHRVQRKLSSALHEETFYGPLYDDKGDLIPHKYSTRKPIERFDKGKHILEIRDEHVRKLVADKARASGWDGSPKAKLPKGWFKAGVFMDSGVEIKKARVTVSINNPARISHRYAVLGNNHHIEVFEDSSIQPGKKGRIKTRVVSTMEAARRARREKDAQQREIVSRNPGEPYRFLMSLARKDSVVATNPSTGERTLCVVQKFSGSEELSTSELDFVIRDVRDSRPAKTGNKSPFRRVTSCQDFKRLEIGKVQVDPLGRVYPAND
jgi:CRISPR-associated endonuclease Csn1